jgi:hypothetical protein
MESHLRQRVNEVTSGGTAPVNAAVFTALNPTARLHLGRILETDLGVSVPDALVLEAMSIEALAAYLIDVVIGSGGSGERGDTVTGRGPTRHEIASPHERTYRQGELP